MGAVKKDEMFVRWHISGSIPSTCCPSAILIFNTFFGPVSDRPFGPRSPNFEKKSQIRKAKQNNKKKQASKY